MRRTTSERFSSIGWKLSWRKWVEGLYGMFSPNIWEIGWPPVSHTPRQFGKFDLVQNWKNHRWYPNEQLCRRPYHDKTKFSCGFGQQKQHEDIFPCLLSVVKCSTCLSVVACALHHRQLCNAPLSRYPSTCTRPQYCYNTTFVFSTVCFIRVSWCILWRNCWSIITFFIQN